MVGYNLFLRGEVDEDGYEEDPMFLRLSYLTYREAAEAKRILEEVYGEDAIEIDVRSSERSLVE